MNEISMRAFPAATPSAPTAEPDEADSAETIAFLAWLNGGELVDADFARRMFLEQERYRDRVTAALQHAGLLMLSQAAQDASPMELPTEPGAEYARGVEAGRYLARSEAAKLIQQAINQANES